MNRIRIRGIVCAVWLLSSAAGVAAAQPPASDVPAQVAGLLKALLYSQQERSDAQKIWEDVERFYAARGFQPAWISHDGRRAARVFIDAMADAHRDGLQASDYGASRWEDRVGRVDERTLTEALRFDVQFSAAAVQFATHVALGVGDTASARDLDVSHLLAGIDGPRAATAALAALEPPHSAYRDLRRALAQYRVLEANGGWPRVPAGTLLKRDEEDPGDAPGAAILAVCRRLAATGDLDGDAAGSGCSPDERDRAVYDVRLEQAVRRFQTRHGLVVDGIVGPNTVAAMNVPVRARIEQIALNMNRWRRLPGELGNPHVLVNAAGFRLEAHENGRSVLEMRVVAGEPETPTPVMSDEITYLDFRPYWNVPRSITEQELLPKIARNPGYLHAERLEVVDGWDEPARIVDPSTIDWHAARRHFPYRLRQRPGPDNALGLVKFMFPNRYSVYLHDTPATHRFEARRRAFSHGCVRVEDPVALAEFLLRDDPQWTRTEIVAAMHGGGRQVVPLPEPVPVHLTYFTAWVQEDVVHFRPDIYGRDASERRAFDRVPDTTTTTDH